MLGLSDRSHDFVVSTASHAHGLSRTRPHRFESPIGLSRTPGQSHLYRPREYDPRARLTDFTAKRIASAGVRERPIGKDHMTKVRGCERP